MFRNVTESKIEREFKKHVRQKGCFVAKFKDITQNGAPDNLVVCGNGHMFFIEFKRPNAKLQPLQLWYHQRLQQLGAKVYCVDNIKDALTCFTTEFTVATQKGKTQ